MTLKELLVQYGNTTDPVKEAEIIERWFVENDFEDLGLSMIARLSVKKIKKLQEDVNYANSILNNAVASAYELGVD